MRLKRRMTALFLALMMVWSIIPTSAYASSTSATVTSSKEMGLFLNAGQSGYSNIITFDFSSLPANAIVKEIKLDAGNVRVGKGLGAIMPQRLRITNPAFETKEVGWDRGKATTISAFTADKAAGIWSVSYYGTNIAPSSGGPRFFCAVEYQSVKLTIAYILE